MLNVVKIELYKIFHRRFILMFWIALLVILAVASISYVNINNYNKKGFQITSFLFGLGVQLSAIFFLIVSCLSIAEEFSYATINSIIVRASKRYQILFGKIISIFIVAILTILIISFFSLAFGWLSGNLTELRESGYLIYSCNYLLSSFLIFSIASVFSFIPLILLGIMIALLFNEIGKSVIVAVLFYFLVNSIIQFTTFSKYFFLSYLSYFPEKISAITNGLSIAFGNEIYLMLFVISLYSVAFAFLDYLVFINKDIW